VSAWWRIARGAIVAAVEPTTCWQFAKLTARKLCWWGRGLCVHQPLHQFGTMAPIWKADQLMPRVSEFMGLEGQDR